jgi:DNA-directed RNA polymerase subunit RPC12/RpoP
MAMIVCIDCGKFFHPFKNGVVFEEGMPTGRSTYMNPEEMEWTSYKLWRSDELACPGCGKHILGGVAFGPFAIQHELHYKELREKCKVRVFVKDCL